jgi:integrase
MPRRLLTDKFCQHAKALADQAQTDYFDEETTGLALRVSSSGRKTWTLHYTGADAKRIRLGLGTYPATSLAAARTNADVARGQAEAGKDPRTRTEAGTLQAVCEEYMKREGNRLRTCEDRQAILDRLVYPTLGQRPIDTIRRSEIVRWLDDIEDENGPVMADRTLSIVQRIFNWHALRSDDFRSPIVRGMMRTSNKERARERILTDEELRKVWKAAGDFGVYGSYIRFLLLTATRRNEAARAPRSEITGNDWLIPAARYKTGVDHLIPLSPQAAALIPPGGRWLFSPNGVNYLSAFSTRKAALNLASGVQGWCNHDLRRSARSLMSRAGVNADIAERCLGHVLPGVRGIYDRYAYRDEKLAAFVALAGLVAEIVR